MSLVSQFLNIRLESIDDLRVKNSDMPPAVAGDKSSRLDINMWIKGRFADLEIQVSDEGDYPERSLYCWALLYSGALATGEDYRDLPPTVVISVIDFVLFKNHKEFHSEFRPCEVTRGNWLTDKMSPHFFELPKAVRAYDELSLQLARKAEA
ncbi:MAG: Rpn family recombination-promoting nuclease/putative transposase [Chitinispirillales bacterium]|jgi:predicted transposase/invertase (TIGR01784 family)|nr:Rpn family recombination-promoting nuclease/putative transposase [Chitinispirillales bacterium]